MTWSGSNSRSLDVQLELLTALQDSKGQVLGPSVVALTSCDRSDLKTVGTYFKWHALGPSVIIHLSSGRFRDSR